MSKLSDDVREIIGELDADGGGYHTSEAASLLVHRYVVAGVCNVDGDPKPKVRTLMRMGASVAFKSYKAEAPADRRRREKAEAWAADEQHDFGEIADDFAFEWLRVYAAWDEGDTAERKMLIRMTLPEVLAVIELKRKKAAEATAVANQLQSIVDNNPHWQDDPGMTLADILGMAE